MSNDVFYRFAPFIQDYIYRCGWDSLRGVQLEAAKVLFESDDNLLLTSSTASGKTEAAFFPVLSMMYEDPPKSFGVIYVAPLKSLINDQFSRIGELLELTGVPVYRWHGDVAASHKIKAIANPEGILQITPESLEAMLMKRQNDIPRIFGDLRFIIIDEIHIMTGTDRGNQIICQLNRIARLIGYQPRRIGLSATIGDARLAAEWLGAGSGRETASPVFTEPHISWRLGAEHFYIQNDSADQTDTGHRQKYAGNTEPVTDGEDADIAENMPDTAPDDNAVEPDMPASIDPGYEFIYDCVKNKKALVFSNSREETEYITATLRQIAERRGEPDRIMIHHGNLSASLREEAEAKLKDDEQDVVTCATLTLELGIDIGRLERVVHLDAPNTVSNFLQRLGRSGRRGAPPEMMLVFREEEALPNTPLPQLIPWSLLRAIAIIQLYIEERFIEPPNIKKLPFSLLFQQTLSVLASSGELTAAKLAERMLSLPAFVNVPREDFRELLLAMLRGDYLEMTDEKGLIVGMKGERLINSFKFYAVFKDSEDYTVRCGSDEIGTITTPPPVGDRFALAGRVWEVEELDMLRKLIYVVGVKGKMEIAWPGDFGEINTRILERMKLILAEDTVYPYLKPNAAKRIEVARDLAKNTGMLVHSLVPLGGYTWCFFPWLGTRSFRTLRRFIARNSAPLKLGSLEFEGCYYMTFRMENGNDYTAVKHWYDIIQKDGIDRAKLVGANEIPAFEKYDEMIPGALLREAFCEDNLRTDEIMRRMPQIMREYSE